MNFKAGDIIYDWEIPQLTQPQLRQVIGALLTHLNVRVEVNYHGDFNIKPNPPPVRDVYDR